jgi:transposase
MSTSLLYHAFGVRGYQYVSTSFVEGQVVFRVKPKRENCRCAACGSAEVTLRGGIERTWRTLPIGHKPAKITLRVPRVHCTSCGVVRQIEVGFAQARRRHTKAFACYALELLRHMTIQDVAQHLGVSWDLIKEIQRQDLQRRFARPKLKHLRRIAIDEIAVAKGHRYLTVVLDLESGRVVFVGDGKGGDALLPFWKRLKASRAKIEAVAMDMSAAYIAAVGKYLPDAAIVFDHFHVIKLMNEKLTALRRQLYREATDRLHKDVLKGTRWLLLKNPEHLDSKRDEPQRLQEALRLNQPLATAYYLKEDLRQLWDQPHKTAAWNFFTSWYLRVMSSGIRIIRQFARTLIGHMWGLLAWYDYPISTGPLEGTNNKIKTMKRQSYGFRDHDFFKLKIYALHETKYALVG